jgi:hypothetical protein
MNRIYGRPDDALVVKAPASPHPGGDAGAITDPL